MIKCVELCCNEIGLKYFISFIIIISFLLNNIRIFLKNIIIKAVGLSKNVWR